MYKRQGERTALRIREVALEQFSRLGFERVTMGGIAQEAGVSQATLHYHFEDKDQLWRAAMLDARGKAHASGLEPVQIRFVGSQRWALDSACGEFGNALGTPLAQDRFRTADGTWIGPGSLPAAPVGVGGLLEPSSALQQQGFIRRGPARLSPLRPMDPGHLVHEIALYRSKAHDAGIAAVWQSRSDDGGLHWSTASVTESALLFELGRTLENSCLVARATRFNGQALEPAWPADCATTPLPSSPPTERPGR